MGVVATLLGERTWAPSINNSHIMNCLSSECTHPRWLAMSIARFKWVLPSMYCGFSVMAYWSPWMAALVSVSMCSTIKQDFETSCNVFPPCYLIRL